MSCSIEDAMRAMAFVFMSRVGFGETDYLPGLIGYRCEFGAVFD